MSTPPRGKLRLFGLDRSGPAPEQTRVGEPLRPWTIPNAIGYVRLALIPAFLIVDYSSAHGVSALAAVLYACAGGGDYLDGLAARLTGQYSRMGALLDPVIDRGLVIAGVVACWTHSLLPRWALAVLIARELLMLAVGPIWVKRGLELRINWPGRIAVGPTMFSLFLAVCGAQAVASGFLYAGLALALLATWFYYRDGMRQLRARKQPAGA